MKKLLLILLALIMCVSLCACGKVSQTNLANFKQRAQTEAQKIIKEKYVYYKSFDIQQVNDNTFNVTCISSRNGEIFDYNFDISFNIYYLENKWNTDSWSETFDIVCHENIYFQHSYSGNTSMVFRFYKIDGSEAYVQYYQYDLDGFVSEGRLRVDLTRETYNDVYGSGICYSFDFGGFQPGRYYLFTDQLRYSSSTKPSYLGSFSKQSVDIEEYWWYKDIPS